MRDRDSSDHLTVDWVKALVRRFIPQRRFYDLRRRADTVLPQLVQFARKVGVYHALDEGQGRHPCQKIKGMNIEPRRD